MAEKRHILRTRFVAAVRQHFQLVPLLQLAIHVATEFHHFETSAMLRRQVLQFVECLDVIPKLEPADRSIKGVLRGSGNGHRRSEADGAGEASGLFGAVSIRFLARRHVMIVLLKIRLARIRSIRTHRGGELFEHSFQLVGGAGFSRHSHRPGGFRFGNLLRSR